MSVYPIPSTETIRANAGSNGHVAVSTFSGGGGASLGLTWAGFRVLWANEFIGAAADTYSANFPTTPVDQSDIRAVTAETIRAVIGDVELDLFEGSPPCASFSNAGARERHWGKTKAYSETRQRTDDLFHEYARLVGELRPRAFVAENVAGLAQGISRGYLIEIVEALQAHGYRAAVWKLDARFLGVAQSRPRLVIVGVRDDLPGFPAKPVPVPEVPLSEAIDPTDDRFYFVRRTPGIDPWRALTEVDEYAQPSIVGFSIAPLAKQLRPGRSHPVRFSLARCSWNAPSFCVVQIAGSVGSASVIHPEGDRKFSVIELKRICGFPDDYVLTGSYLQRVERLGRAVSPPMYRAVGESISAWLTTVK